MPTDEEKLTSELCCERCESPHAKRRRQNTRYVDDEMNWVVLCDECMAENDAHWEEMWRWYYENCM